ncbi:MAG TPA: RNA-binding protein, partial [Faecalibacterium sp.]|nr:RNA-binding protein [Faecalibacterium sp.]
NRNGGFRGGRGSSSRNGGPRNGRPAGSRGPRPSSVPERTYAPRDAETAAPVAPKRT